MKSLILLGLLLCQSAFATCSTDDALKQAKKKLKEGIERSVQLSVLMDGGSATVELSDIKMNSFIKDDVTKVLMYRKETVHNSNTGVSINDMIGNYRAIEANDCNLIGSSISVYDDEL